MPAFLLGVWNFDSYDFGLCVSNQPSVKSLDLRVQRTPLGRDIAQHVENLLVDSSRLPVKYLPPGPVLLYISLSQ